MKTYVYTKTRMGMITASLFIVTPNWKEPSVHQLLNDKLSVIHPHNRLFLCDKREQTAIISNNEWLSSALCYGEEVRHSEPHAPRLRLCDILEKAALWQRESHQRFPGTGAWGREWGTEGHEGTSEGKGNVCLDGRGVYRVDSVFVKTHQTMHLNKVTFIECKFNLSNI